MTRAHKERIDPQISLNKLGEYFQAQAGRRKTILREQKRPSEFIVTRYKDAYAGILEYMTGRADEDAILEKVVALEATDSGSDFHIQDCHCSAEALSAFLDAVDCEDWSRFEIEAGPQSSKLTIEGVEVSVRPDLLLKCVDKKGNVCLGVVKFYMPKTTSLAKNSGEHVATILYRHAEEHLADEDTRVCPEHCYLWDVPKKKIYRAGRSWQMRMREVSDTCAEIRDRWAML